MAKLSTDELLDAFKEMTLLELSAFVKQFEETFDVTAAAPVAVAGPAGPAAAAEEPVEQDEFDAAVLESLDALAHVARRVQFKLARRGTGQQLPKKADVLFVVLDQQYRDDILLHATRRPARWS